MHSHFTNCSAIQKTAAAISQTTAKPDSYPTTNQAPSESAMTTLYHFNQNIDGFDVFESGITLIARKSDGAVYMVNNSLKSVDNINLRPRMTAAEAQKNKGGN